MLRTRNQQEPCSPPDGSLTEAARSLAAATRSNQGLPLIVDDPAALSRIATLVRNHDYVCKSERPSNEHDLMQPEGRPFGGVT